MATPQVKPISVLLVDDDEEDFILTNSMLGEVAEPRFSLSWVDSFEAALKALADGEHDVCLLDYCLGERNGLELLREVLGRSCPTPLIILTGKAPDGVDAEAMRAGAADYLPKSQLSPEHLARAIRHAIERGLILCHLRELASRDPLTGLYNRREMEFVIGEESNRYRRYGRPTSLILMDVDHFKAINDHYGHVTGDEVLRWLGRLIRRTLRAVDLPCRYGGEEFAIIAPETTARQAFDMAERLRRVIAGNPFTGFGRDAAELALRVSVSLGVASIPSDVESGYALVEAADRALYRAKEAGRNRTVRFGDIRGEPAAFAART